MGWMEEGRVSAAAALCKCCAWLFLFSWAAFWRPGLGVVVDGTGKRPHRERSKKNGYDESASVCRSIALPCRNTLLLGIRSCWTSCEDDARHTREINQCHPHVMT